MYNEHDSLTYKQKITLDRLICIKNKLINESMSLFVIELLGKEETLLA